MHKEPWIGPVALSPSYIHANWHAVTAFDPKAGRLGVAFEIAGQPVIRLAITRKHAEDLSRLITMFLSGLLPDGGTDQRSESAGTQNPMSGEISSALKSVSSDGDGQCA